ncbi:hypothetical protein HDU93_006730 [Gonapodya sp. JEL0774]|nr:hypothetical protein HDU93_006730 [Gonapodya sp. JEL0774]
MLLLQDASAQFAQFHNQAVMDLYGPRLLVGKLASTKNILKSLDKTVVEGKGELKKTKLHRKEGQFFGDLVPFSEDAGLAPPFYKDSHFRLAKYLREFVDKEFAPNIFEWEEAGGVTPAIYKRFGELGLLALEHAPAIYKELPSNFPRVAGLKDEEINTFHKLVARNEYMRVGSRGCVNGIFAGVTIGLSPVWHGAKPHIKARVLNDVLSGNNWCCLAITEPETGSDTQNITTTAKLTDDGKYYIVNGTKKWITNAIWAEYFITAVRTGGPGGAGVSMLLIERKHGGITTKKMQLQGGWASGTTFVTFEDVKVPAENILGTVNQGFKLLMHNFNFERLFNICSSIYSARAVYDEALRYAHKRKTFGKLLIEHPVIRWKLANMARQIESAQAWQEMLAHQFDTFKDHAQLNERIGGPIALLKAHGSIVVEYVAREAAQIFGGLAYTRGGQGGKVERTYRDVRAYAIPAGSEEIMLDFGIRESIKRAKQLGAPLADVKL